MSTTPPAAPRGKRPPSRSRTSLVTAAAIAGVLLAGTAAVAANIGILNAADSSEIGELAATDELLAAAPEQAETTVTTADTTAPTTTATVPAAVSGSVQQYDIAEAGTVWLATTRSGVAIDHVEPGVGWSPTFTQTDLRSLRIDFTNAGRTIVFTAALGADGVVVVDVTEPSTVIGGPAAGTLSSGAPVPTTAGEYDDDHEFEYDDEYDEYDEYDEHDDDEYDDDENEYEGADDDD